MRDQSKQIEYHIVEVERVCNIGKEKYEDNPSVYFSESMPTNIEELDICYIRTSLQYAENWQQVLSDIINSNPEYILLKHLSAGDIPTYCTAQTSTDRVIPYWFINQHELFDYLKNRGYQLKWTKEDERIDRNMFKNIPETHIIDNTISTLLQKNEK